MKKFNIIRDMKLFYYFMICLFMTVIGYLVLFGQMSSSMKDSGVPINFTLIYVIIIIYFCFTLYFILKDLLVRFNICDEYITYGTFGWGEIRYDQIDSIDFDKDIMLVRNNKKKKLRVFNLDINREKYIEMLTMIKEKAELDFSIENAMDALKYYNNYEYREAGKPLRLNGWIFIIFIMMIFSAASYSLMLLVSGLYYLLPYPSQQFINPILLLIMLIASIVTIVFIAKKRNLAPNIIIGFNIMNLLFTISNNLLSSSYNDNYLFSIFSGIIIQLPLILLMYRYFKISKRVRYTFIYDNFQKVERVNVIKDPGFKLFTNEPASLYGIFTWLGVPALSIVLIIVMIVVLIFSFV